MLIYDEIINKLNGSNNLIEILSNLDKDPLDMLHENEPTIENSLGEVISKLSCVTIQMWNNQNLLYEIRLMNHEEFNNKYGNNMDLLLTIIKRSCNLNIQRARLVDSIDQKILEMKQSGTL